MRVRSLLLGVLFALTCVMEAAEPVPPQLGGADFTVGQLPDGLFKNQVLALEPATRALVEAEMRAHPFPAADAASRRVGASGVIHYACAPFDRRFAGPRAVPAPPLVARAALPVSPFPAALKWHSKPGSSNVLYIDFDGHALTGTRWQVEEGVTATWNCRAYSTDADESTYSDAEQALMRGMWQRVSEDFAGFDIDVTTEQPAVWTSTTAHALVTKSKDKNGLPLPHDGYGGVAYVNVFGRADFSYNGTAPALSPAWVMEYDDMYSGETVSHEVGHNLGLGHDGDAFEEYYFGHPIASGSTFTWGAIMGGGVVPDISQWSKGDYLGASNSEDDLAKISAKLGYRADEAGDTIAAAAPLGSSGSTVRQSGVISAGTDTDVFIFTTAAGPVSFQATTHRLTASDWGANLDMALDLLDGSGTVLATNDPPNEIHPSLTYTVTTAGTYYLRLKPASQGTPLAATTTGYVVYADQGNYTITGTINAAPIITSPTTATAAVGYAFSYGITGSNGPTSYNATGLPSWLTVDTASGKLTGTPSTTGISSVLISATNASGTGSASLTISAVQHPLIVSLLVSTAQVGTAYSYQIAATGLPTAYTATGLPAGLAVDAAGLITGTPTATGISSVALTATNTFGTGSAVLVLTVTPPVPVAVPIRSWDFESDPGWTLAGAWQWGQPQGTGTVAGQDPATAFGGSRVVGYNLSTVQGGVLGAYAPNLAPTPATLPSLNTSGYDRISLRFQRWLGVEVGQYDHAAIEYSLDGVEWAVLWTNPAGSGNLVDAAWTAQVLELPEECANEPLLAFRFVMGSTDSAVQYGGWTLDEVGVFGIVTGGPRITSASTLSTAVGTPFAYAITASGSPSSFSAMNLPTGLSVDSASGIISGTPTLSGTYRITVGATNAITTGLQHVAVTVLPAAPTITSTASATGQVGRAFSYVVQGSNQPTAYGASNLPAGLVIDAASGVISGVPMTAGTVTATITATNAGGTGATALTVIVHPASPVIASPATAIGQVGAMFVYDISGSNSPTAYASTALPDGLGLDGATGRISGTPTVAGTTSVTISASNAGGAGVQTLVLTIQPANSSGVLTSGETGCGTGTVSVILLGGLLLAARRRRQ